MVLPTERDQIGDPLGTETGIGAVMEIDVGYSANPASLGEFGGAVALLGCSPVVGEEVVAVGAKTKAAQSSGKEFALSLR